MEKALLPHLPSQNKRIHWRIPVASPGSTGGTDQGDRACLLPKLGPISQNPRAAQSTRSRKHNLECMRAMPDRWLFPWELIPHAKHLVCFALILWLLPTFHAYLTRAQIHSSHTVSLAPPPGSSQLCVSYPPQPFLLIEAKWSHLVGPGTMSLLIRSLSGGPIFQSGSFI